MSDRITPYLTYSSDMDCNLEPSHAVGVDSHWKQMGCQKGSYSAAVADKVVQVPSSFLRSDAETRMFDDFGLPFA